MNYVNVLNQNVNLLDKEPFFWIIAELNKILFGGTERTFFIFAIIGVSLKLYVTPILSLLTYISMFLIIQEMTQIRQGVAVGFVFWAFHDLIQKKTHSFFIKILVATLFHYSAILMTIFYFFSRRKINFFFYFLLPLAGLVLHYTSIPYELSYKLISKLPSFLSYKPNLYFSLMEQGKLMEVNPVRMANLLFLLIY